ncbi:mercuric reductase [Deferribacteraceae bacterium V6Fe1]|nr:mercuric reductase [Deferribacteraceae bacterium V6Fe1]
MGRLNLSPKDIYNEQLLNNVHPNDWLNPEPESIYNLVVIGAGTAGLISAIATASLGGKVALIEKDLMGGDCLNVGCVPSKSIIKSARVAHILKNAEKYGFENCGFSESAFEKVMERMRKIRADISHNDSVKRYSGLGVDVFLGEGRFVGKDTIEVDGKILKFKKAVIATGARAVAPDILGLKESGYLTNENIFNLEKLPEHLLVIGGGPIGCELAQSFKRLGAKVTVVEYSRILPREDAEAAKIIEDVLKNDGVEILNNSKVVEVKRLENGKKSVSVQSVDGSGIVKIEVDEILVAAGRAPNVEGLNLDVVDVEYDLREGIKVNDFLQTTNKNIYAAGDCCMKWKFTHAADAAAQIVVQNALFKGRKRLSTLIMPWCTYTDPEVAHVGMYEEDATSKGLSVEYFKFDMSENDRAQADGETVGFVKVMVKKGTDKILGATVVAAHAGEMINEFTVAMANNVGLGKLAGVIHPYPTQSEVVKRVAGLYNKSRLTPTVAKILKWWLKFQRR